MIELTSIVTGYLLGSLPTAYIITKYRMGIDIREVGVCNMGGANVIREVGKWEGILTLIIDMGKGAFAILIAQLLGVSLIWVLVAGFAAMLGHNYPVWLGFRGGKGIATVMGIFFIISPLAMVGTTLTIGVFLALTRNFFIAVGIAAPFFILFLLYSEGAGEIFLFAMIITAFQLFRSRGRLKEITTLIANVTKRLKKAT